MRFLVLILLAVMTLLDRSLASDSTCEFPLLDEPSVASPETCTQINSEIYQKKIIDYICSSSCTDIHACLDNYEKMKTDPKVLKALNRVEKATSVYSKERQLEKCGNFEPQAPIDADDQVTWDHFKEFVEARREINHLLKSKLATIKNQCIRRDKTSGAYMRFKRTARYAELLNQCNTK